MSHGFTEAPEYYQSTRARAPRSLLMDAVGMIGPKAVEALDIGCGSGADVEYLLGQGLRVTALDRSPLVGPYLEALSHQESLNVAIADFNDFDYKEYDLVHAGFSLPFTDPANFRRTFGRIKQSLRPGGVFAGQFFGVNDGWNRPSSSATFVSVEEAKQMLGDLDVRTFNEIEEERKLADGSIKYWHIFDIIACRQNG